jgi:hypothetical protein
VDTVHERFGTKDIEKDELLPKIIEYSGQNPGQLTSNQSLQLKMMKKDKYRKEIANQARDFEGL